jgi:hypothetical protein
MPGLTRPIVPLAIPLWLDHIFKYLDICLGGRTLYLRAKDFYSLIFLF